MRYVISGREPSGLFRYFEDLCAIPHASGNEGGAADYLEAFARERGLAFRRDALHNVTILRPASPGCEDAPPLLLQAHTDMVCVKDPGVAHDFDRDGLRLTVEENILRAQGTSLGADDGIGVALALQALADDTVRRPPLECLFTTQEETGLEGVNSISLQGLRGRMLMNLDGADERCIVAGSAGGARLLLSRPVEMPAGGGYALEVRLSGLLSGHSGEDIHRGRANAIKLTARTLHRIGSETPFRLAALEGGSKSNAIPAECTAVIVLPDQEQRDRAAGLVRETAAELDAEYGAAEPGLTLSCRPVQCPPAMASEACSRELTAFLYVLPAGPFVRNPALGDVVTSSNNPAVVSLKNGQALVCCMCRAALPSLQRENHSLIETLCARFGFAMAVDNEYGCWPYSEHSPLRTLYAQCAAQILGRTPETVLLHAGLESAFFMERIPGIDIITVGPNMGGLHSTREYLDLASCERVWKILRTLMERLAGER